jgi:hypothetical protein
MSECIAAIQVTPDSSPGLRVPCSNCICAGDVFKPCPEAGSWLASTDCGVYKDAREVIPQRTDRAAWRRQIAGHLFNASDFFMQAM